MIIGKLGIKIKKYINIKPIYALLCASIVVGTVLIDFITKKLVMTTMHIGETIPLIPGILNLKYITNDGAAFGSFAEHRWVFMSLSVVMLIAITVLIIIWDRAKPIFYISSSMVLGGGIGNMIDRVAYGTVVDFIDFCAFPEIWMWVFNGADSFVCVGSALLVVYYLVDIIGTTVKTQQVVSESDADTEPTKGESTLGSGFDAVNPEKNENTSASDNAPEGDES
ncbi:MAG: signal peptidase II [Clostridia bacterium]|nr:signal peptidase II [Clostridia bacterium]